ncbi:hypothetical protein ACI65C_000958 [Semiaphis heraclei]
MGSRESDVSHGPVRARSRPLHGAASANTCPHRHAPIKEPAARSAGNSTPSNVVPRTSYVVTLITLHRISVIIVVVKTILQCHYNIIFVIIYYNITVRYHSYYLLPDPNNT